MPPAAKESRLLTHAAACWRQNSLAKLCQRSHRPWGTVRGSQAELQFQHLNLKKKHETPQENTKHDMEAKVLLLCCVRMLRAIQPGPTSLRSCQPLMLQPAITGSRDTKCNRGKRRKEKSWGYICPPTLRLPSTAISPLPSSKLLSSSLIQNQPESTD